jgi:hypothetical protein
MPGLSGFLHDATSLHRLVGAVSQFCQQQRTFRTYTEATGIFFDHLEGLAQRTLEYLQETAQKAGRTRRLREQRQKLVAIKKGWRELHRLVKPAADAHTLRVPVPLLGFLERRLQRVTGLAQAKIVILLSPELNYFQERHGQIRDAVARLADTLGTKPWQDSLGFIGIPYSQGTSIFTNLLICHELGHFAAEELREMVRLSGAIERALRRRVRNFGRASESDQARCRRQLCDWAEELYADLFAIHLVGPAFSFASIELFNLLALLHKSGSVEFNESHPAEACRLKEHMLQLDRLGWWRALRGFESEHLALIRHFGRVPDSEYFYRFEEDPTLGKALLAAFLDLRPTIRAAVARTAGGLSIGLGEFRRWNRHIQQYLGHGVVPSTLVVNRRFIHPPPLTVLNAGFCFYLGSILSLIRKTQGRKPAVLNHRAKLSGRVEAWTMKAIEDEKLLASQAAEDQA